ncbi:MAG: polyprenyl synthetase family protein [Clostridia bacterium]|nr:polyprenyl synthetase family protein [Clostridia bacterium]
MTLKEYKAIVEKELDKVFADDSLPQNVIFESSRYSLLAGGKRLRAIFVLEFCRLFSGSYEKAIPFARAIEMIHAYSLIHDDLPCMDDDDFRRGKPTNHKVYGEAMALLAGDNLLNGAYEIMLEESIKGPEYARAGFEMARAAGGYGMIGGQVLDIKEGIKTEEELRLMVSLKTGKLFYAACIAGAILGGANEEQLKKVECYADNLGLAFQIADDVLDVVGDFEKLGKPINSDEENEKYTFVSVYGLEKAKEKVNELTDIAINAVKDIEGSELVIDIADSLRNRDN